MKKRFIFTQLLSIITTFGIAQESSQDKINNALTQKNITNLDLSNDKLSKIPSEVFKIKNLKTLNLEGNQITEIPSEITKLKNLENLYILENNLTKISNEILKSNIKDVGTTDQSISNSSILETYFYLKGINDIESMNLIANTTNLDLTKSTESISNNNLIWKSSSHAFGFIELGGEEIKSAVNIEPDLSLINKTLKITHDLLYVHDYPGSGRHQVLFDFEGRNQLASGDGQEIHFNQTSEVQEGQFSSVLSVPIFIGINVGKEGLAFKVSTTNVKNENDENIMAMLNSKEIQGGLKLVNTLNPIVPIVTSFADGISKQILSRNRNKRIQQFSLGLNLSEGSSQAKLRCGTYIAVQVIDLPGWNWNDWIYNKSNGVMVSKSDRTKTIPFNYIVFTITETN
ncbi:leucine-rich repeat domain-containing protein [Sphingobacterium detergens]